MCMCTPSYKSVYLLVVDADGLQCSPTGSSESGEKKKQWESQGHSRGKNDQVMGERVRTFGVQQRCESWLCHLPTQSLSNERHNDHLSELMRGIPKTKYLNPMCNIWLAQNACHVPSPLALGLSVPAGLGQGDGPCWSSSMLTFPRAP